MQGQEKIRDMEEFNLIYLDCVFDMDISNDFICIKQN